MSIKYEPEKYTIVGSFSKRWGGDTDPIMLAALFEHMKTVLVFKDHNPLMTTRKEILDRLDYAGELGSDDDIYIVIDAAARRFTRSMEELQSCLEDFLAGWRACKAAMASAPVKRKK